MAILGGALGLLLAAEASPLLQVLVPPVLTGELGVSAAAIDARVLCFTLLVSLFAAMGAGALPALRGARPDLESVLRASAQPAPRSTALSILAAAQMAVALVLMVGAGLLLHSFREQRGAVLGFEARQLWTAQITLPAARYPDGPAREAVARLLEERLAAAPGVRGAGLLTVNPLRGWTWSAPIAVGEQAIVGVNYRLATPGLLAAMRIPLLRGRGLESHDDASGPRVALVSAHLSARLWPGVDALGRRLRLARPGAPEVEVVGVVGDVRDQEAVLDAWYLPYAQNAGSGAAETLHLMIRSPLDEAALAREVRAAVSAVDPLLALDAQSEMEAVRAGTLAPDRFGAAAVSALALLGLLLAAVGTSGVLAYALGRRTHEIGVRLALGASPRALGNSVLFAGLRLAGSGIAAGLLLAVGLQRLLRARLPELEASPPGIFAAAAALLLLVALLASWMPARRAARIQPVEALRAQ